MVEYIGGRPLKYGRPIALPLPQLSCKLAGLKNVWAHVYVAYVYIHVHNMYTCVSIYTHVRT